MRDCLKICLFAFVLVVSFARTARGDILLNGSLTADQTDVPSWWNFAGDKAMLVCEKSAGPNGSPAVRFDANLAEKRRSATLRQYGLALATNGRYRVSCLVRAKDFRPDGKDAGVRIINKGWTETWGVTIPRGTYDWQRIEETVKIAPSKDYSLAIRLPEFAGVLWVAGVAVEPADAETAAATGVSKYLSMARELRFVPRRPLLCAVPETTGEMLFELHGELEGLTAADCAIVLMTGGVRENLPCTFGPFTLKLPSAPTGGTFRLAVVERASGRELHGRDFTYRTVPETTESKGCRLNSLVTEFVREPLAAGTGKDYRFSLAVPGWVFVSASAEAVELDGARVIGPDTPRHETFRALAAGPHVLSVRSATGGEVILRRIPELFDYCPNASVVPEGPKFDWAFQEKYVLPAVTVLNGGHIPEAEIPAVRASGRRWLANLISRDLKSAEDLVGRVNAHPGMNEARYDGVTCDEQFYQDPQLNSDYAKGLWGVKGFDGRSIYTWIVGRATGSPIDLDFMSAAVNASHGTGKLLTEIYCSTCETEEEAVGHVRSRTKGAIEDMRIHMPWAIPNYGIILGNYTQFPRISLAVHPEVDYRYYLDLQFNILANDPDFEGMGCTGVWGSYYADAELHRWTFMLMRHYFVEGRREMLSPKYGFRYLPGHVANGDFRQGLASWRASGTVKAGHKTGLGTAEGRYHSAELGDRYAVFVRQEDSVSTLSQTLTGLEPGRLYALGFMTFDSAFPDCDKAKSRRFGVDAAFSSGARILDDLSWEHIARKGAVKKRGPFATKVNYRYLVFEASAASAELVFSDEHVKVGEGVGLNGISVRPYLKP